MAKISFFPIKYNCLQITFKVKYLSKLLPPHFQKNQKNSTIEALWGTVISPLPKKGTVQYSAKNTVLLDTLYESIF